MSNKKDTKSKKVEKVEAYLPNMIKLYKESVVPAMVSRFNYVNSMQVPKLLSISLIWALEMLKLIVKNLKVLYPSLSSLLVKSQLLQNPSPISQILKLERVSQLVVKLH